jgi:hypothetical protein
MRRLSLVLAAALLVGIVPAARADIIAALDQPSPSGTDSDIALYDFSTATKLPLPAGVNTSANEFHPSMDASGRLLVLERIAADGSRRIIMADRSTGHLSDLFTTTEAAVIRPTTPTITHDGTTVFTGQQSAGDPNGFPVDRLQRIDVTGFPAATYPKTTVTGTLSQPSGTLTTLNPSALSAKAAEWTISSAGLSSDGAGFGFFPTVFQNAYHVALDPANSGLAVIDPGGSTGASGGDLRVVNLASGASFSQGSALTVTNTTADESRPGFTRDGRYLAFMRRNSLGDHLHVIDTLQGGVEVAPYIKTSTSVSALTQIRIFGNVSLILTSTLLASPTISSFGLISSSLSQPAPVGILVQRIVGHRSLVGNSEPIVKTVGKVPFGRQRKGKLRLHWNFTVNGRRLKRGRYLITLRALDPKTGRPRDLARPIALHVRH